MNGYMTEGFGWMNYLLHAEYYSKPKRIYFRDHNNAYIKHNGSFIPVYFNYNAFANDGRIPMRASDLGAWVMADRTA